MAHRPLLWMLLSACWPSIQAGLLEQAIETVQRTIFPDQETKNAFANLPVVKSSVVSTLNGSADNPTSMHFRNQDFSIVLGKDGLKTIDSILDRVFNFTTKLQMQRGKLFNSSTTYENTPQNIENLSSPHEEHNLFIGSEGKQRNSNSQLHEKDIHRVSESLKSLIRKRPILTDRDAPNYFDPADGLLKVNDEFNRFSGETSFTTNPPKKNDSAVLSSIASEQETLVQDARKQDALSKGDQSEAITLTTQLQENDGSAEQLPDGGQNSVLDDGVGDRPGEDERERLVALQLPGVGSFVVQKPPEKPKLSVKQKWLLGPLLEPQSTNPLPVSSFLVATTKAARVSKNSSQTSNLHQFFSSGRALDESENGSEHPVILSEPAQSMTTVPSFSNTVVTTKERIEQDFKLSVRSSDRKSNSFNDTATTVLQQVDDEFQEDVWGTRFDLLGIPKKVLQGPNIFEHDLRHHLPREVLPLALKQQMQATASSDAGRNSDRNGKKGKEIDEIENGPTENHTTFSINSPNLEHIVIYTNNPNIEVGNLSSTPSSVNISESDHSNTTKVLTDDELPLYPPLGNFDVDVTLATIEAEDTTLTTSGAPSNDDASDLNNVNQEVSVANDTNTQATQSSSSIFFNATSPGNTFQGNHMHQDNSSTNAVFEGSSYQFYSTPSNTDMYGRGTMKTRPSKYGDYQSYASPGNTFSTIETQINDFVSETSSAGESSRSQLANSPKSTLSSSYGSLTNDAISPLSYSDSLAWPTQKDKSQDFVLQAQFFDPTLQQENLQDYFKKIFRLNQLVPIDLNRAIANLLMAESSSFRQLNERDPFLQLSPAQQSILFALADFSSPTRAQQFSHTQPRLRNIGENQGWLANSNAEEAARNIYEALVFASRQNVKSQPFHRRNSFAPSRDRISLPFDRRSRSLR
ncbi:hypothetical protein FHG87_009063 [Trinorchestia longiramus]|nr:hypothetical protein FHG87_009063 [Trinorchestia longiramus]